MDPITVIAALGVVVAAIALIPTFAQWLRSRRASGQALSSSIRPFIITASDYGPLVYEEHFDSAATDWAIPDSASIEGSQLVLTEGTAASPLSSEEYSDFVFDMKFRHLNPDGLAEISVYLRYQVPSCPEGNCSVQIWASGDWKTLGSRRIRGDEAMRLLTDTPAPHLYRDEWNKLTIVAHGSRYEIYVDDWFVERFVDPTYRSGKFVLSTHHGNAAFDYVRVYSLP